MSQSIDVLTIAALPEEDREATMGQMFQQLLPLNVEQQKNALGDLLRQMGEKASDQQYLDLCATNLKLAAMLPDKTLHQFLAVRMQAAAELPSELAERDGTLLRQALEHADHGIREKITRNM
ncbi:MAG: dehydrogenase [Firmicutes bacterium]|jgi:hypothetical protein|nr:dehydrogenase [Bacillota bacterium]MCL5972070.1 dehydrogenase [Bacillota bacterium]